MYSQRAKVGNQESSAKTRLVNCGVSNSIHIETAISSQSLFERAVWLALDTEFPQLFRGEAYVGKLSEIVRESDFIKT